MSEATYPIRIWDLGGELPTLEGFGDLGGEQNGSAQPSLPWSSPCPYTGWLAGWLIDSQYGEAKSSTHGQCEGNEHFDGNPAWTLGHILFWIHYA